MDTTIRNADLNSLVTLLRDQTARKLDVIAPASKITAEGGMLVIRGTQPLITEDGVSMGDGSYLPTRICDEGLAAKLGVPPGYLRRLRESRADLWDANIGGWLAGPADGEPDPRSFMVRCFRSDDDTAGVARAFLSDKYAAFDNFDALVAALDGVREAGVDVEIDSCDLTDRRMYVKVRAPEVALLAPELLKGYRSPFTGAQAADNPVVFAGFEIGNSETGGGAFSITPRLVVQVCANGVKITKDALRAVHLGGRLDEGPVRWTDDTGRKMVQLITAKTRDAVATFLDVDYMRRVIQDLERSSSTPVGDPAAAIAFVSKKLVFSEAVQASVLDHFIKGGQVTAGGVLGAVTSVAQTLSDADAAADLEGVAVRAMELAASR